MVRNTKISFIGLLITGFLIYLNSGTHNTVNTLLDINDTKVAKND